MGCDSLVYRPNNTPYKTGNTRRYHRTKYCRYREQLDKIGFSFDWDREVRTSDPEYYKWTQWIFIQLFNSWYNKTSDRAEHIDAPDLRNLRKTATPT